MGELDGVGMREGASKKVEGTGVAGQGDGKELAGEEGAAGWTTAPGDGCDAGAGAGSVVFTDEVESIGGGLPADLIWRWDDCGVAVNN